MAKYLVTGGAGFIGSHLVDLLLSRGHQVVVLDALSFGADTRNLPDGVKIFGAIGRQRAGNLPDEKCLLVIGDVAESDLVLDLVSKTDACFHLAAQTHVDRSYGDVRPFVDSNVVGSYAVLEAFRKQPEKRLVFMSTDEVYGDKAEGFSSETDPVEPRNIYSALKASGDLLAQTYAAIYGINLVIARPANNYGPRQLEEKLVPKIVNTLIRRMYQGFDGKVPVYGDGAQVRDWLYVKDTVEALLALHDRGKAGQIYNVGRNEFRTVIEVVQEISFLMGTEWTDHVEYVADRIRGDRRYALNIHKTAMELDWKSKVKFSNGLDETVSWYKWAYSTGARA